mgnify:CR=1 FL=1
MWYEETDPPPESCELRRVTKQPAFAPVPLHGFHPGVPDPVQAPVDQDTRAHKSLVFEYLPRRVARPPGESEIQKSGPRQVKRDAANCHPQSDETAET